MKTREELRQAVVDALATIAPEVDFAQIDADRPLRAQIDLDSFDFLNAIIRLNETLGIEIPERDYARLSTLNSTVDYLLARVSR